MRYIQHPDYVQYCNDMMLIQACQAIVTVVVLWPLIVKIFGMR
jgi:hypothetical protein